MFLCAMSIAAVLIQTLYQREKNYAMMAGVMVSIVSIEMNCLQSFNQRQMEKLREGKAPFPEFGAGDNLAVFIKIKEGERERIQKFEGLCLAFKRAGLHSSFLVRRVSGGLGIERVFPLFSPIIDRIECLRRGRVRRSKIYYIRALSRKKARIRERRTHVHSENVASSADVSATI